MITKLEFFLIDISPEETIDKAQAAADNALNSFSIDSARIDTFDEFKEMMAEFYCLVESNMIGLEKPRQMNLSMDWGRCSFLLLDKYGKHRGDQAAFRIAQSGVEGGLYSVLKYVAKTLAQQFTTNWIGVRISQFWKSLSTEEFFTVSQEYLDKYRHILSPEILEEGPLIFAAKFMEFLEHHPQMMKDLKNIR